MAIPLLTSRTPALDWRSPRTGHLPDPAAAPADVVVPVYGAAHDLARCVAAVARHTDLARHRLVLVLDGPQPEAVHEVLAAHVGDARPIDPADAGNGARAGAGAAEGAGVAVLRLPERRGFVAAVNRGMELSRRDVVLLNSDAAVTAGWLEKLQAAAFSSPAVATATPFSNHATLCSLPRFLEENLLPSGHDLDSFARLVEERSRRRYPLLPTGVGVCLYVKRKALDEVGLFDEARFGLGYGEENDFCARALEAGYVHVLDDATFVFHAGGRSFGGERRAAMRRAARALRRRHPGYYPMIARFLREDPLAPVRARVTEALAPPRAGPPRPPERVLHVVHGWPPHARAGTELYAHWLAHRQAAEREVAVYARLADPGRSTGQAVELQDGPVRVRLVVNNFDRRDPLARNALIDRRLDRDLDRLLDEIRPDLVHVHHLAGHALSLAARVSRRRIPLVLQLQDWWLACARTNLLHRDGRPCSGPGPVKCSQCLPLTRRRPRSLLNPLLYRLRRRLARRTIERADALICGSRSLATTLGAYGLLREGDPLHVVPYGIDLADRVAAAERPRRRAGRDEGPLRFGYVGSVLPHKGVDVAAAAFAEVDPGRAVLEVWGDAAADPGFTAMLRALVPEPAMSIRGPFAEADKAAVLDRFDALVVPSMAAESFGLVAREALHRGVPVIASRTTALAEMMEQDDTGAAFEPGDVGGLRRIVAEIVADPAILDRWSALRPAVRGMDEHREEIERIYARALTRRSP